MISVRPIGSCPINNFEFQRGDKVVLAEGPYQGDACRVGEVSREGNDLEFLESDQRRFRHVGAFKCTTLSLHQRA